MKIFGFERFPACRTVAPTTATNAAAADLAWTGLLKPVTALSGTRWREPVHVSRSHCHRNVQKTCRMTMTDFKKLNTLSPLRCTPKSFRGRVAIPRKSISTFVHFFVHLYMYIHLPKNCHVHYTLYMILKIWSRYIHRSPMMRSCYHTDWILKKL